MTKTTRGTRLAVLPFLVLLAACAAPADEPGDGDGSGETTLSSEDSLAAAGGGLWLSAAEIKALPASGPAWDNVRAAASGLTGNADLSDNNSDHDVDTLAAAYVAVRTGDAAMRAKAIRNIESVYTSRFARVLELSRNIQAYVIAADVLGPDGWDSARFKTFVRGLARKPLDGHSGGNNLAETAALSANNWGCHARAALTLIGLYTGDTALIWIAVDAQRAFVSGQGGRLKYTGTNWHAGTPRAGINAPGAKIAGHDVSGVIPEDQRRTGEYTWPAPKGMYPWGALEGTVVAGVVLHRAGLLPFDTGSNAIVRAAKWLTYTNVNPASGDDRWQPWVLNKVGGAGLATTSTSSGKNMGFTDWTHR